MFSPNDKKVWNKKNNGIRRPILKTAKTIRKSTIGRSIHKINVIVLYISFQICICLLCLMIYNISTESWEIKKMKEGRESKQTFFSNVTNVVWILGIVYNRWKSIITLPYEFPSVRLPTLSHFIFFILICCFDSYIMMLIFCVDLTFSIQAIVDLGYFDGIQRNSLSEIHIGSRECMHDEWLCNWH